MILISCKFSSSRDTARQNDGKANGYKKMTKKKQFAPYTRKDISAQSMARQYTKKTCDNDMDASETPRSVSIAPSTHCAYLYAELRMILLAAI